MTLPEVRAIVTNGHYHRVFYDRDDPVPFGLCIYKEDDKWYVFATDERCEKMGLCKFDNEDEACQSFLKRLEAGRILGDN